MLKRRLIITILIILCLSCTIPGFADQEGFPEVSIQIFSTATATVTPLPTPTPTPMPLARILQGDWAIFLGDYDQALREYENAMDADPSSEVQASARLGIGRTLYLKGMYIEASYALNTLVSTYPESEQLPKAYYFLGKCAEALGDYQAAANAYQAYLSYDLGLIDGFMRELRGDAFVTAGAYAEAIDAYEQALQDPMLAEPTSVRIKIGKAYVSMGDHANGIRIFMDVYASSNNDYLKAQMNLLAGISYMAIGLPDQAYARYQDSVINFPKAYDSYTGLVELVNAGVQVNELHRGLVNYFAGHYGLALDAFIHYLGATSEHDGTVHYYKGLAHRALEQYPEAIQEWNVLINQYAGDRFWFDAWDQVAYTQWYFLDRPRQAAEILLSFVSGYSNASQAPYMLFTAGRIYERGNYLEDAAKTWLRVMDEYPNSEMSTRALFLSGITYYRMADYVRAQNNFQRLLVLSVTPYDQSMAYFWIAKAQFAQDDLEGARSNWETCVYRDPSGYYSERAREILNDEPLLYASTLFDLGYDLAMEREKAEEWLRSTFNVPSDIDLSSLGDLASDIHLRRGNAFWDLGLYKEAHQEFEILRSSIQDDPVSNFRILDHLLELGMFRSAIFTSRRILDLANLDNYATLTAPIYFNHIRFGIYFRELVIAQAIDLGFHPLLLFSIMRQESMFESFVQSSAGARGLMQLMPATAREMVTFRGYPENYVDDDLYKPVVNIPIGVSYLVRQRDYFDGDLYASLAAYNGGPGNAIQWARLSAGDPDLFLEVIRFDETRQYIMRISENFDIYRMFYERN